MLEAVKHVFCIAAGFTGDYFRFYIQHYWQTAFAAVLGVGGAAILVYLS